MPTTAPFKVLGNDRRKFSAAVLAALLLSFWFGAGRAEAAEKHPFGLDDYSALHTARAVSVSPDGKAILYRLTHDGERGPAKVEWHLAELSGANDRKLDLPENFEPLGFTAPGSALFGVYEVERKGQLAIVPLASGQATQILALPNGIRSAVISPDGKKFAVLADPSPKDPLAEVRHVVENERTGIFVAGANGENGAWWCPNLTSAGEIAWSPDSSQIAVASPLQKIGHHDVRTPIDVCSAAGSRRVAEIPNSTAGLAWASGGKELAFASTTTDVLTPDHLWTVPVSGGAAVDRTPKLEGSITSVSGDGHGNVWAELHRGVSVEYAIYADGNLGRPIHWPGGTVSGAPAFSPFTTGTETVAFTVEDPAHAANVAVLRGGELQRITHAGDDTLANVELGETRVVNWTAKDGTRLQGIVAFPAGYTAGKKYPFLVFPHGGPEANDTLGFDFFLKLLSGFGYVVMQPEYRGSTGYGSEFLQAIYQHFGDRAYSDVDSATDFAVAQGWADPNRLAIFGWSAGGFMTSWTVTQTHRYKAAVEGAGITDWFSFIPTSDIAQVDYDARWEEKDAEPFLKFSAANFADQVTTPLLILHGEADLRVPAFQGREYFVLLAERGKTVRMVTYPGSPHFPRLAEQRRNVFSEIRDWLARYNP